MRRRALGRDCLMCAQYYRGDGEFGKKKIDFFVNSVLWLLMGMKELIMFVCMWGRPLKSMKLL